MKLKSIFSSEKYFNVFSVLCTEIPNPLWKKLEIGIVPDLSSYYDEIDQNIQIHVVREKILETDKEWALDEVLNIKMLWKQITDENKETIWTYFNILIKLIELEYKLV